MKHRQSITWDDIGEPYTCAHPDSVSLGSATYSNDEIGWSLNFKPQHRPVLLDLLRKLDALDTEPAEDREAERTAEDKPVDSTEAGR